MRSFLYKLQFTTPVHFGPSDSALSLYSSGATFCADTLFSALCHTALALQGPAGLEALCRWVQAGELLLSDGNLNLFSSDKGGDAMKNIDFKQIFALVKQGVVGKLMEVQSADGDVVEIWIE